jgi:hypothetical protein
VHPAGRQGLSLRGGQLADAVVEALLTHDGGGSAANLRRDRISAEMRRRVAEHPDPAIRDGHADFVRRMVDREVGFAVLTCVPRRRDPTRPDRRLRDLRHPDHHSAHDERP